MKRLALAAAVACLWGWALPGTGRAGMITYSDKVTASGSLGGTPFTDKVVTLTFTGDTSNVTGSGFITNSTPTATVNIQGVGMATFTDSMNVADKTDGAFFFEDNGLVLVEIPNSVFTTYDLKSPLGPLAFSNTLLNSISANTNAGTFMFTLTYNGSSTLTATTTATPEPASLTLLGIGAAGLLGYGWRRNRPA
jgi:hypothetical protein